MLLYRGLMMVKFILDGGAQKGIEQVEPQVREQGSLQDGHPGDLQDGEQGGHFLMRIIHICLLDGVAQPGLQQVQRQVQGAQRGQHQRGALRVGLQGGHFLMKIILICFFLFSYYFKINARWNCSTRTAR